MTMAAAAMTHAQAEYVHRKHRENNRNQIFPEDIAPHEHLSFRMPKKVASGELRRRSHTRHAEPPPPGSRCVPRRAPRRALSPSRSLALALT